MQRAVVPPVLRCLLLFGLLASCGCGGPGAKDKSGGVGNKVGTGVHREEPPLAGGKDKAARAPDAAVGVMDALPGKDALPPKVEEPLVGGDRKPARQGAKSGVLTAGSFDDNLDPEPYRKFFRQIGQDSVLRDLPSRFLGHRLIVTVKDGAAQPVGNARVTIRSEGASAVELVTRTDGRVIFIPAWDQVPADADFQVSVRPPGGAAEVRETVNRTATEHTVTLSAFKASPPQELDLCLVIDTTGSMGDELEFLKAELRSIARTIHERFPQVQQRYSLVFYRDKGDQYVTRKFDFTTSLDDVRNNLHAQSAGGGGDMPEAVHKALEDANGLEWRNGNAARVLFLVSDAPPHTEHFVSTMNAVNGLRKKGVAIYPMACSGYDNPTEFMMRTSALVTGGQFLFLTDDSGVGNGHAEPHLTNYRVEKLERLMVRMIASELAGKRIAAAPNDVVRTVGQPR